MPGAGSEPAGWVTIAATIAARCRGAGLDLLSPFTVSWYNDAVAPAHRLPDLGRSRALALLIGNTRALWLPFLDALRSTPALREGADPLDRYVEQAVRGALRVLPHRWALRFDHETTPAPVAMQQLAQIAGLAYLAPGRLSVHPSFGPWIALRAAVVVDVDGPRGEPPALPRPCNECERGCLQALNAVGSYGDAGATPSADWRAWLTVRDACPLGREHRYDDEQIRYHYTKDRTVLSRILRR